jgi:hypothetical protein
MIATEIGEAAGGHPHPVQAILVEPVRGGFHCEMGHALARELIERVVQGHRIRGRERTVGFTLGRYHPDGADTRRGEACGFPDLSRERCDRGLAAGSRDRGDGLRLPRMKLRRSKRERSPGIGNRDDRDAGGNIAAFGEDRGSACLCSPSVFAPAIATNRSPGLTARLSAVTPRMSVAPASASGWAIPSRMSESFIGAMFHAARGGASLFLPSPRETRRSYRARADAVAARICRSAVGRSKRGSSPSMGAILAITFAVVGAAFQPEVA